MLFLIRSLSLRLPDAMRTRLQDLVPKTVMCMLVNKVKDEIASELVHRLYAQITSVDSLLRGTLAAHLFRLRFPSSWRIDAQHSRASASFAVVSVRRTGFCTAHQGASPAISPLPNQSQPRLAESDDVAARRRVLTDHLRMMNRAMAILNEVRDFSLTATSTSGATVPPTAATVFLPAGSPYVGAGAVPSATTSASSHTYTGYYSGPISAPQVATTHVPVPMPSAPAATTAQTTSSQSGGSPPGPPGAGGPAARLSAGPGGGHGLGMSNDAPALGSGPGGSVRAVTSASS